MTHGSVFSGIGGPEVAASMLGWENLFHCEINPFGRKILDYWYPNAESYEDITKTDFTKWRGRVNVLTGGFPCQPFSFAGKRKGADDERYLWPHMHRCIAEIQPDWVVCENVGGILTMVEQGSAVEVAGAPSLFDEDDSVHRYQYRGTFTLERICCDLEADGYEVQPILIPACAVGAPHRRDRVFIVGHRLTADTRSGGQSASEQQGQRERTAVQRESGVESFDGAGGLGAPFAPADTDGRGGSSRSESAEGNRPGTDHLSGQTRRRQGHASVGDNGLSAVLRTATDTDGDRGLQVHEHVESQLADGAVAIGISGERPAADSNIDRHPAQAADSGIEGRGRSDDGQPSQWSEQAEWIERLHTFLRNQGQGDLAGCGRWDIFPSVSPVHRRNDGIPFDVDGIAIPFAIGSRDKFAYWRNESLKAYGNAIVPQVMYEIFRAIEQVEEI